MNAKKNGNRKADGFWRASARVFRDRRAVVVAGMLLALHIVLAMFVSLPLTPTVRISVSFITNVVTGHLFGPLMGIIAGALGDLLQFAIRPTGGYFPGWTLNAAIGGFVYGLMFYRRAPRENGAAALHSRTKTEEKMAESSYAGAGISAASQSGMTGGSSSPAVSESKKSAGRRRLASDYVSAGIFALVLLCWFVLPFLQVTEKATGAVQNSGSALAYLTGGAGKTENGSPATLAAAAAVCAAAGLALSLFRRRIPAVLVSAAACLWLLLPVYSDRSVLRAEAGFYLIAAGFFACIAVNLAAVLRQRSMDAAFLLRCFCTMLFMAVVVQMLLGTIWCVLMMTNGKGFWYYLVPRAVKSLIQLPFNTVLAYYVIRALKQLRLR